MKLQADLVDGIKEYLNLLPIKTLQGGYGYRARGAVQSLECLDENLYSAVVRGGQDYEIELEFDDGKWLADCTCPIGVDCKHIAATFLELLRQAAGNGRNPNRKSSAPAPAQNSPPAPQPPRSPLADKLAEKLQRPLRREETQFVRQVQNVFAKARDRFLTEPDLATMVEHPRPSSLDYWKALGLWPRFPSDDFQFWLYVAWELRQRQWKHPSFMDAITDLSLVEPAMKQWAREKAIEEWNTRFTAFDPTSPKSEPRTLELRLAVLQDEARLQWRHDPGAPFAELKQAQARKFGDDLERGELVLEADSLALWSASYKPWSYQTWWSFRYRDATARPALNRLLRLPLPSGRIVTAEGQPLPRHAEPLQLKLRTPENADGDYEIFLTLADGSPAPEIYCALSGQPALYLTQRGLFSGPRADLLETELLTTIPAGALETAGGLRFLHAAGVPLPEHMAQRVKSVPVTVTLACALKPTYSGSQNEEISITVAAAAPGMKGELYTTRGWEIERRNAATKKSGLVNGVIAVHDRDAQKHFPRVLESLPGLKWSYQEDWRLRLTKKTPEAFVAWLKTLPPEIEVLLDKELATLRDEPVSGTVALDIVEAGIDWFDLKVAINVSDTTLTPEELNLLLNARGGFVRLGKNGWRRLRFNFTPEDDEQLARLGVNAKDFSAAPQRFHALQLADDAAKKFLTPDRVEKIQRRVSELKTRVAPALPPVIHAEMRPYQTEGFHFLAYLTSNRFGGVLADDMGLGKTLQTLAWLAWLRGSASASEASGGAPPPEQTAPQRIDPAPGGAAASANCSLVVCPKSVMDNWRAEAERFYPGLRVRLWRGEPFAELTAARQKTDLVVLNYAQLRGLPPEMTGAPWLAVILDEAQYIKNPDSQTAQAARALKAAHRLALTGTPIENRLLDLWSIFGFAMPGALGNRSHFLRRFDAKDDPLARRRLAARVRPFLLRRTKAQVAKDLPDRVEEDLFCEMEGDQKTLYRAELKRARQILLGLKTNKQLNDQRFNLLTSLLRLRQICCHPALVDAKLRAAESAKLAALEDLLEPLMEEGHKVLVFSQFVTMLDLVRETVRQRNWPYFYLDGSTEHRGELVQEFQTAKGGAAFLVSLKAGGFGLNLTAASYVVLFDPWWNPAVENQAIDRTHRIGQTSKVMAYRLLMRDSIEEKIRALQKQKAALAGDVLGEERFAQSLTLDDLRFLFAD